MFCRISYTVLFALSAMAADAGTYYVATDGKPDNDGSRERPRPSVEYALSKAGGGHTILVRPGLYRSPPLVPPCGGEGVENEEKLLSVLGGASV